MTATLVCPNDSCPAREPYERVTWQAPTSISYGHETFDGADMDCPECGTQGVVPEEVAT